MNLNIDQIRSPRTVWLGKTKIHYQEIVDSTNKWALRALQEGALRGEVFLADYQNSGSGRKERTWESSAGKNIMISFIDIPPRDISKVPQLTLVAGVSIEEGLEKTFPDLSFKLKWPNDIFLSNKKLGGILSQYDSHLGKVVIGIGLNINQEPKKFSKLVSQTATSLLSHTHTIIDREPLINSLLESYEKWRAIYEDSGIAPIIKAWNQKAIWNKGQRVKVLEDENAYEGEVTGLNEEGFLIVKVGNENRVVISGDIQT